MDNSVCFEVGSQMFTEVLLSEYTVHYLSEIK